MAKILSFDRSEILRETERDKGTQKMTIPKRHQLVSMLIAVALVTAPLLVSTPADAASGLFRMKRTWWGGTSTASPADPYISKDFHPRATGPNRHRPRRPT